MTTDSRRATPTGSGRAGRGPAAVLLVLTCLFTTLGVWQVYRRSWKHHLIAAVNERSTAFPVAVPGPPAWPGITAERDAYRHVFATGRFLARHDTLIKAVTDLGAGYWVLAPLETGPGAGHFTILVNRGFVLPEHKSDYAPAPAGTVHVVGLLRVTEPGGGFLRHNDPATDHWYSRDVAAIAAARHVDHAAPYFVDADTALDQPGGPVGGLTVIQFSDSHAVYALTWFGLALLSAWGARRVLRREDDDDVATAM